MKIALNWPHAGEWRPEETSSPYFLSFSLSPSRKKLRMEEVKKRHKEREVKITINDENEKLQLPFFEID